MADSSLAGPTGSMWVVTAVADIIAIVGYPQYVVARPAGMIPALAVIGVLLTLNLVLREELRRTGNLVLHD